MEWQNAKVMGKLLTFLGHVGSVFGLDVVSSLVESLHKQFAEPRKKLIEIVCVGDVEDFFHGIFHNV